MMRDAADRFASSSNGGGGAVQNGAIASDPLSEYREGLALLLRPSEKLETLRTLDTELRGTSARLQDE
jgi:hypothetical protein